MKKIITPILASLIIVVFSFCQKTKDKINEATEFDMNYSTEVTMPAIASTLTLPSGTVQTIEFNTPEISTDSKNRFVSESTTQDLIEEIKMTKFVISNSNGNLNFLKSLSIYIKTTNLGDVLVATKTNIPKDTNMVNADLQDVNIKQYIFKDKIQFKVKVDVVVGAGASGEQKLKTSQTVHVKGKRI